MRRYALTAATSIGYGAVVFGISLLIGHELGLAFQIAFTLPVLIGGVFIGRFIARKVLWPS